VRRFLWAISLCFVLGVTGLCQTPDDSPASKQDVERYLQAVHSHEMMRQTIEAMAKPMHQMVHEQYLRDKDKLPPDFEARINKIMDDMMNEMPFDEMMDAMVPSYQKHFPMGDMDALVAFYTGPVGQKVLRELPSIMSEAMQTMMPLMRKNVDRMSERIQQQVAEMSKQSNHQGAKDTPSNKN
jgi:hypothetical protein